MAVPQSDLGYALGLKMKNKKTSDIFRSGNKLFLSCSLLLILLIISMDIHPSSAASDSSEAAAESLLNKSALNALPAGTVINTSQVKGGINTGFYSSQINKAVKKRITGNSYKENKEIPLSDLRYIRVLYYGFDKKTHIGELIVNKSISKDILAIFKELYKAKYPIEKMVLIDEYDAEDEASMEDNNTSAFNYRTIAGSKTLSKHAMGLAVDINPLYNPCVEKTNGKTVVAPASGKKYTDRSLANEYYIKKNDICYKAFTKRGFTWGGSWNSLKDYQHFQKSK